MIILLILIYSRCRISLFKTIGKLFRFFSQLIMNYIRLIKEEQGRLSEDSRFRHLCKIDICDQNTLQHKIRSQFNRFGKDSEISTLVRELRQIDDVRCAHIVFTFFLGLFFYETSSLFHEAIERKASRRLIEAGHKDDFPFLWFLICLFHDLGYSQENLKERSRVDTQWVNSRRIGHLSGVPILYGNVYKNYFNYRKSEFHLTDHGIYAGLSMYGDLCNIYRLHSNWNQNLDKLYNLASWVVLAHNIWFTLDTDTKKSQIYRNYKLEKLILETDGRNNVVKYPITLQEHPLLFLFCLVDLIEPMKKIGNAECCNSIDFKLKDNTLTISSELKCNIMEEYFKNIANASEWLCDVTKNTSQGIIIKLCYAMCANYSQEF